MVRAVLFDAVETLIRPWPSVGAVYARAARGCGLRCPAGALEAQFRPAYRDLSPERFCGRDGLRTSEGRERRWWGRVVALTFERAGCGTPSPAAVAAALDEFSRGAAWRPLPGAMQTLRRLRSAGLGLGLVSNYDSRLHRVLEELGMAPFFAAVAISSEVGSAKPSPRIYRAALRQLRVRPGDALMVGDREREDYQGARAAGMRALLLDPAGRHAGPHVIRRLAQVPSRPGDATSG